MTVLQADAIVEIPGNRVRFFGTGGKMLLPCPATVGAMVSSVPVHAIITSDVLRKKLADQFGVEVTCPATIKRALQAIARGAGTTVPYWRVIKQNGELNAYFPDGVAGQAARLRDEGVEIDTHGKSPRVAEFRARLVP